MMIWILSSQLGLASPVPKLPMVNVGIDGAKKKFGYDGSTGISAASAKSKQPTSKEHSTFHEGALACLLEEIEEANIGTSHFNRMAERIDKLVSDDAERIDNLVPNSSGLSSSSTSSFSTSSSQSSSLALIDSDTSPQPFRRNPTRLKNKRNPALGHSDHSNKGGVGSHKTTNGFAMSTKVRGGIYNNLY